MILTGLGVVGAIHSGERAMLQPAQRKILAILIAAGKTGLSSDRFADEVWPTALPKEWESAVRQSIHRMRRTVGLETIVNTTRHYALHPETSVDVWTLLKVGASALDTGFEDDTGFEEDMAELINGEPYPGIERTPLVQSSIDQITTARVRLLDRVADTGSPVAEGWLESARQLLTLEPYREDVLACVAKLHVSADLHALATQILSEGIARIELELDAPAGVQVTRFHRQLMSGAPTQAPGLPTAAAVPAARVVGTVDIYEHELRIERSELLTSAQAALQSTGLVLSGVSGSGKTALARNLARAAHARGRHVVWLSAQRGHTVAYGPIVAVLPTLREQLSPLMNDGGDSYERSQCWSSALDALGRHFDGRPLTVVVDDAQWLDSHTQQFIEFAAMSRSARELHLAIVGRVSAGQSTWTELSESLSRSGFQQIDVSPFTREELLVLIGRMHPSSSSKQRSDLTDAIVSSRASLPAIAFELLRTADPETLLPTHRWNPSSTGRLWTDSVSSPTRAVSAGAAVIGLNFRLSEVAALLGLSITEVLGAVDELLDAELAVTGERPDEFSFVHLLVQGAFEATLDRRTLRELHLRASHDEISMDPHRRARHLLGAGPLVDVSDLMDALLDSATTYRRGGSFREAADMYRRILALDAGSENARLLLDFADSLDRSGGDGWQIRERAFDLAEAAHEHELCAEIAGAGAHENENIDGDERRVAMLDRVRMDLLGEVSRQRHQVVLARELSFLGKHDRAKQLGAEVVRSAVDADGRLAGWLASWPSYLIDPASTWPPFPEDRAAATSVALRSQMLQLECVRSLMLGEDTKARVLLKECATPAMTVNPLRSWFVSNIEAMLAFTDGQWQKSHSIAQAGFSRAQRSGIASAFSAHAAQVFSHHWVQDRQAELLPLLELAAPDVQQTMLAQAALAVAMARVPERSGEAQTLMSRITRRAYSSSAPLAPSVCALLASATSQETAPEVIDALREMVESFAGTALVVGTGLVSMGPATRALSFLAKTPSERADLLEAAVAEADNWNLPTWSVRCRTDLFDLTGETRWLAEATARAEGTELAILLEKL